MVRKPHHDNGAKRGIQKQGTVTSGYSPAVTKMNASLWYNLEQPAQPALAGLKAAEWALLIRAGCVAAGATALRERYLAIWTAGWALLVVSRLAGAHGAGDADSGALCSRG